MKAFTAILAILAVAFILLLMFTKHIPWNLGSLLIGVVSLGFSFSLLFKKN